MVPPTCPNVANSRTTRRNHAVTGNFWTAPLWLSDGLKATQTVCYLIDASLAPQYPGIRHTPPQNVAMHTYPCMRVVAVCAGHTPWDASDQRCTTLPRQNSPAIRCRSVDRALP